MGSSSVGRSVEKRKSPRISSAADKEKIGSKFGDEVNYDMYHSDNDEFVPLRTLMERMSRKGNPSKKSKVVSGNSYPSNSIEPPTVHKQRRASISRPPAVSKKTRSGGRDSQVSSPMKAQKRLPRLDTRSSPMALYLAVKDLKYAQKRDIEAIGFGHFVHFAISRVPSTLGFWLVENFDTTCMSIILDGGRWLRITEDDVESHLGATRGSLSVESHLGATI